MVVFLFAKYTTDIPCSVRVLCLHCFATRRVEGRQCT